MTNGQSIYQTVVRHFLFKDLTSAQLNELTGKQPGQIVETIKPLTSLMTEYGLSVKTIQPFDYKRFAREGKDYLFEMYDNQEVKQYLTQVNIWELKPLTQKFLGTVRPMNRRATLEDIDDFLGEGRLVSVSLQDASIVLVVGADGDTYITSEKPIDRDKLWDAMGSEQNMSEVTGYMLRKVGLRLDQFAIQKQPTLSRAYATRLIHDGKILVNGKANKPGYRIREGDDITIDYNEADQPDIPDIDLPILYEDDDCIVINKPVGVLTHNKGSRFVEATVASFVRSRAKVLEGERPGIVHRLDRATSGVMICAKTPAALSWLQKQFHDRLAQKTYTAIVQGELKLDEAIIDMAIERNPKAPASFRVSPNGKDAQTHYKTVKVSDKYSLLELKPRTGRTHQLRVHLAAQKHPIVGDTLYDGQKADRMYLHAHQLTITLPSGETKTFTAPVPPEFAKKLEV